MIDLLLGGSSEETALYISRLIPQLLLRVSALEEQSIAYAEIIRMLRGELVAQNLLNPAKWNDLIQAVAEGLSKQDTSPVEHKRAAEIGKFIKEFSSDDVCADAEAEGDIRQNFGRG